MNLNDVNHRIQYFVVKFQQNGYIRIQPRGGGEGGCGKRSASITARFMSIIWYTRLFSDPRIVEELLRSFVHEEFVKDLDFASIKKRKLQHDR